MIRNLLKICFKNFSLFYEYIFLMFNLGIFSLKFCCFVTFLALNIITIFSAFSNSFPNFNLYMNRIRIYKNDNGPMN